MRIEIRCNGVRGEARWQSFPDFYARLISMHRSSERGGILSGIRLNEADNLVSLRMQTPLQIIPRIALTLVAAVSVSCSSGGSSSRPPRPYVPRVAVPESSRLSPTERQFLPDVEDALLDAGYRPTQGNADYRLEMQLGNRAMSATSSLALFHGPTEVVRAFATSGGPKILFKRNSVIEDSFQKCLVEFQTKLPRNPTGGFGGGSQTWSENVSPPQQPAADWQRGW